MQGRGRSDDKETYILETFTPSTEGKITKPLRRRQRRNFVDPAVERVEHRDDRRYSLSRSCKSAITAQRAKHGPMHDVQRPIPQAGNSITFDKQVDASCLNYIVAWELHARDMRITHRVTSPRHAREKRRPRMSPAIANPVPPPRRCTSQ